MFRQTKEISSFPKREDRPWPLPPQPPIHWVPRALFPLATYLFSAEVKNEWSYTFTPLYAILACTHTPLPSSRLHCWNFYIVSHTSHFTAC